MLIFMITKDNNIIPNNLSAAMGKHHERKWHEEVEDNKFQKLESLLRLGNPKQQKDAIEELKKIRDRENERNRLLRKLAGHPE